MTTWPEEGEKIDYAFFALRKRDDNNKKSTKSILNVKETGDVMNCKGKGGV